MNYVLCQEFAKHDHFKTETKFLKYQPHNTKNVWWNKRFGNVQKNILQMCIHQHQNTGKDKVIKCLMDPIAAKDFIRSTQKWLTKPQRNNQNTIGNRTRSNHHQATVWEWDWVSVECSQKPKAQICLSRPDKISPLIILLIHKKPFYKQVADWELPLTSWLLFIFPV